MDTTPGSETVKNLVELRTKGFMEPNLEYQRGEVWKFHQQKRLIDSVLRKYPLPVIYLHKKSATVAGMTKESYEIIDGQQRIAALRDFVEGAFPLYNVSDPNAKFPSFLLEQDCAWGGKYFDSLSPELKQQLLDTTIPVAYITAEDDKEVRDLFVRLQSGKPLNAQEQRDSYPGAFTEFILKLGGKPDINRFPGHDFFQRVLKMKPRHDEGKTRQLAAQIAILYFRRKANGTYSDINRDTINDYYDTHLDFDINTPECERLRKILDFLDAKFGGWQGPKLVAHNAIHLVLLVDSLMTSDYTHSWEDSLARAQAQFSKELAESAKAAKDGQPHDTWLQYGQWTRTNSDKGENIERRHRYYTSKMIEFLGNLTPRDPKRAFNNLERQIIYWRDGQKCQMTGCGSTVDWASAEVHHVDEHQDGGKTVIGNGVLMHKDCHPKGEKAKSFAQEYWKTHTRPE